MKSLNSGRVFCIFIAPGNHQPVTFLKHISFFGLQTAPCSFLQNSPQFDCSLRKCRERFVYYEFLSSTKYVCHSSTFSHRIKGPHFICWGHYQFRGYLQQRYIYCAIRTPILCLGNSRYIIWRKKCNDPKVCSSQSITTKFGQTNVQQKALISLLEDIGHY